MSLTVDFASLLLDANKLTEGLQISWQSIGDIASELVERPALGSYQPVGKIVESTEVWILLMDELKLFSFDLDWHYSHSWQLSELLEACSRALRCSTVMSRDVLAIHINLRAV